MATITRKRPLETVSDQLPKNKKIKCEMNNLQQQQQILKNQQYLQEQIIILKEEIEKIKTLLFNPINYIS